MGVGSWVYVNVNGLKFASRGCLRGGCAATEDAIPGSFLVQKLKFKSPHVWTSLDECTDGHESLRLDVVQRTGQIRQFGKSLYIVDRTGGDVLR